MKLKRRLVLKTIAAVALMTGTLFALGEILGESKEELQLKYDVAVYNHGTGRVTVTFTLEDEGRLKPISSVDLHIPSAEKHKAGGFKSDLTIAMALREHDGKKVARAHLRKDWAERAFIEVKTGHLDGKLTPMSWHLHPIPLKEIVSESKPHQK